MYPMWHMEILLSRIAQYGNEKNKDILKCLMDGYEAKLNYKSCFGYGFRTNFFARSQVIAKIDKTFIEELPDKELNPVVSSGIIDEQTLNYLDEFSYKLIK